MPVKYWSSAGLMLTYWCNARCSSCYLCCGPERDEWMGVQRAVAVWRGLIEASPHGCRVHLTGGEPFGDYELLLAICRAAGREGLGPLEKIETNAFWATDAKVIRDRLAELDGVGMKKLVISTDPYHQQFVPIARPRLLADVAGEVLGPDRVQVRWRDWLGAGRDTDELAEQDRRELFARYAADGRDRLNGRATEMLGGLCEQKAMGQFADECCKEALLRSKHVHIGPEGAIMPGTCAGIVLGRAKTRTASDVSEAWRQLEADWQDRPVVGTLAMAGPVGLARKAQALGFAPRDRYAAKCQLCWQVRKFLFARGWGAPELGPAWMYADEACK